MAIIDNPIVVGGGGAVDQDSALKYMLEHKTNYTGVAAGLTSLTEVPAFTQPSGISVFASMFDGCSALTTVPTMTYPSTGTVDMARMFRGCVYITSQPNVDISRTNDTTSMFDGCYRLAGAFTATRASGTANSARMFYGCTNLTSVNITSSAGGTGFKNCDSMFYGCTKLTSATFPMYVSNTSLSSMGSVFDGCTVLTTVSITYGPSTSSGMFVTSATNMFRDCPYLTSISITRYGASTQRPIDFTFCSSVARMFSGCKRLATLPTMQNFRNATTFSEMFKSCEALSSVPQMDMSGATSSTSLQNFVSGCSGLTNAGLENVLASLATWSGSSNKTLKYIGLTSAQATTATSLSGWSALSAAGWTTGY